MSEPAIVIDRFGDRWMNIVWRKPPADIAERTRRRVTMHLLPFLFFLYILAYLDRFNVSVAALKMKLSPEEHGLGFTDDIIGHGAGLFFWGYWILELPSTISVAKWGARWVFVRILVLWGICAAVCGLVGLPLMHSFFGWLPHAESVSPGVWGDVTNYVSQLPDNAAYQFYFFRFMLGFFEGGFFPTVIVYLSYWFRARSSESNCLLHGCDSFFRRCGHSAFRSAVENKFFGTAWLALDFYFGRHRASHCRICDVVFPPGSTAGCPLAPRRGTKNAAGRTRPRTSRQEKATATGRGCITWARWHF